MAAETAGADQRALDDITAHQSAVLQSYRVELSLDLLDEQGSLLDAVIGFAFDTPNARHLDLRIVGVAHSTASAIAACRLCLACP
jgi:hypothetical protein